MLHNSISKKVLNITGVVLFSLLSVLSACKDTPVESGIVASPPDDGSLGFNLLSSLTTATDTVLRIRVSWKAPNDPLGAPDFYRHSMVASKVVTDTTTGPLPTLKQVNGLVDTVFVKLNLVNDTVTLTSNVWSVRRGIQSQTAGVGKLFIRRGDRAPLPPDSIKVDTIVVPASPVIGNTASILFNSKVNVNAVNDESYKSMFGNPTDGVSMYKSGNVTYLTITQK